MRKNPEPGRRRRRGRVVLVALVGAFAALIANAVLTSRETAPAKADIGRVVRLAGPDLQVREDGRRDAPAIILLHGYAGSMRWWSRLVPRLANDHRVIRFDLLGHGGSEKPRDAGAYEFERQGEALAEALERLGVERSLVVAHSMGGSAAAALASAAPELVRGVVLLDTPPRSRYIELPLAARLGVWPVVGPLIHRLSPDASVRRSLGDAFADGVEVPGEFVADYRDMTYSSYKDVREASFAYLDERALDDRLSDLRLPLVVVFGVEDEIVKAGALDEYRDVPGVQVRELRGVGHAPQWEAPRATDALVRRLERSLRAHG